MGWQLGTVPGVSPAPLSKCPPSDPICLSDSLDEDLATNSLDSIAQALTLLNNSANGVNPDSPPSTSPSSPVIAKPHPHTANPTPSSQSSMSKEVSSVQRQTVTPASRPSSASMNTMPAAKPRPPPTTTPLQKPVGTSGMKPGQATPLSAQMKNPSSKLCDSGTPQRSLNTVHPKSFQQVTTPSLSSSHLQKKATPTGHHQQRFITPMQATITKSSQSSSSPIIKLTPRPSAQATPSGCAPRLLGPTQCPTITTPSSGPGNHPSTSNPQNLVPAHRSPASTLPPSGPTHLPSVSTPPSPSSHRSTVQTPLCSAYRASVSTPPPNFTHRSPAATPPSVSSPAPSSSRPSVPTPPTYSPKSSGFKPPFSPTPVATPPTSSFQDCNVTSSSVMTNHGQRQRVGGASQSNKTSATRASAMGLPSLSDSALLNQVQKQITC